MKNTSDNQLKEISCEEMAKEILYKVFKIINSGVNVEFEEDMGEGTITIYFEDAHTHCGFPGATDDELIKSIYNLLIKNEGLSFAIYLDSKRK